MDDAGDKKIKRTHTFDRSLLARLEELARKERRKVSEQLAILLEDALERAERPRGGRQDKESGNSAPVFVGG
jgi:hypothetical protein